MTVALISKVLCHHMNEVSHHNSIENDVIQYGMELLIDTILKISFVIMLGVAIGKGLETVVILGVFCSIRFQAGGKHADTSLGCLMCMILICIISLIGYTNIKINDLTIVFIYIISFCMIIWRSPQTINIKYFSKSIIYKKKKYSILLLSLFMYASLVSLQIRGLIIYPIILEIISLFPCYKGHERWKIK